jgi:hypothetical protein
VKEPDIAASLGLRLAFAVGALFMLALWAGVSCG